MTSVGDDDPFKDPSLAGSRTPQPQQSDNAPGTTLAVGRNASLTLGTDSLVVLDDEQLPERKGAHNCFGLFPRKNKTTRSIPFFNVLWAELSDDEITVHYAQPTSKETVKVEYINYTLEKTDRTYVDAWIERLLDRAYGASQRRKRIKVLVNPFGGKGTAQKIYLRHIAPIFAAARCEIDVESTKYGGHGVDIAENIDADAFDVIACASGDGVVHEVFNGLGKKQDAARTINKVAVVQLPCGSGNAMSINCNGTCSPSLATLAIVKGLRTPMDLVSITQGDRRILSFLSQSVGIAAESDLGTDNIRWMGSSRFVFGFLVRLINKKVYPADIAYKYEAETKASVREAYNAEASKPPPMQDTRPVPPADTGLPELKHGTINDPLSSSWSVEPFDNLGNFFAGNLAYINPDQNMFPAALPFDGCLDIVRAAGDVSRTKAISALLAIHKQTFFDLPQIGYSKVSAYRLTPKNQETGCISIDGERVPFEPFQAEVHRGLGTTLSKTGHLYEARGP